HSEISDAKDKADEILKSSTSNALYSSHMADASSDHVELEKSYYMIARNKKFSTYLDKALLMIEDRSFGICQTCEELIQKERLEEVPHTTKCFECKSSR
ncbi:TraR/DksA C4-type zinc finger protein, partial [Candidatus Marinimicrobia bacterium]|nr:TraR/DksA C4-type zinc finger protein [Candidatus Neomarinimicrobiota bacterium]